MYIKSLRLINFRNHGDTVISFDPKLNIFYGNNAQGKTNIIEAIFYAAVGKSHRAGNDSETVRLGFADGHTQLNFSRFDIDQTVEFDFFTDKRRRIRLNSHSVAMKDLIGTFTAVLFSPEDLSLVKGSPSLRRKFLDREISQADKTYYQNLLSFNKILAQRNALLKAIRDKKTVVAALYPWNEQFAEYAAKIASKRLQSIERINHFTSMAAESLSGQKENISLAYKIEGHEKKEDSDLFLWYNKTLAAQQTADIMRGSTGIGPQHDDLDIYINDISLKSFGSQGQQRTAVLALKLSELEFIKEEKGEYPVLLLDDVMSELDEGRRKELLIFLLNKKIQTVITATDKNYFPADSPGIFRRVEKGAIFNV